VRHRKKDSEGLSQGWQNMQYPELPYLKRYCN
jgi:hypothetical protein